MTALRCRHRNFDTSRVGPGWRRRSSASVGLSGGRRHRSGASDPLSGCRPAQGRLCPAPKRPCRAVGPLDRVRPAQASEWGCQPDNRGRASVIAGNRRSARPAWRAGGRGNAAGWGSFETRAPLVRLRRRDCRTGRRSRTVPGEVVGWPAMRRCVDLCGAHAFQA